jgi:hypothetical protein
MQASSNLTTQPISNNPNIIITITNPKVIDIIHEHLVHSSFLTCCLWMIYDDDDDDDQLVVIIIIIHHTCMHTWNCALMDERLHGLWIDEEGSKFAKIMHS